MNLASILDNAALNWPEQTAIRYRGESISYARLHAAAAAHAEDLASREIARGDVVAIFSLTTPHFTIAYFGALRAGAIVVALNPAMKRDAIATQLEHSGAKILVVDATHLPEPIAAEVYAAADALPDIECLAFTNNSTSLPPRFQPVSFDASDRADSSDRSTPSTLPDDTAVVLYTSGTTGAPKGAQLTHLNLLLNAILFRDAQRFNHDDIVFITVPLAYVIGQTGLMNAAFAAGATVVLNPQFDPSATLALMAKERITKMIGVPALYSRLLQAARENPAALAVLRETWQMACCGGSPVPVPLWEQIAAVFNTTVIIGYGLTETSPLISSSTWHTPPRSQIVGKPVLGVEVKVVGESGGIVAPGETGELWTRGHHVMKGYLNNEEANAAAFADGWFRTGDLARQDSEGNFYIVGRLKEMIIRAGNKVYPSEVEQVLLEHPAVAMAAVVGIENFATGEEVVGCIVKRADAPESELIDWCKSRLPHYAYPRQIHFMDCFPLNATGKILKHELKQKLEALV